MENFDNNVLENILDRLPFGVASRAKRVCKSWKTILDDRSHNEVGFLFACHDNSDDFKDNKVQLYFGQEYDHVDGNKMNYYYSHETLMEMEHCRFAWRSSNHEDFMVGSCNGLVCLQKGGGIGTPAEPFAICNPITGEFIFLKPNSSREWNKHKQVVTGFGYCQTTKEYKVFRLYTLDWCRSHVQVYTLGSNEWRDIETSINHTFFDSGIFANGVLHWLDAGGSAVVAFDLEDEEFRDFPLPPPELLERGASFSYDDLRLLGGNLCWVQVYEAHIDIWAYKRNHRDSNDARYRTEEHDEKHDYYRQNSWKWFEEFSIECDYQPFAITRSNQVLLLDDNNFHCYDPKTRTIGKFEDDNCMDCSYIEAIPHANSYISLKDFGETWYWPGFSSTGLQTNNYDMLEEVREAYKCRRRNRQSFVFYFILFFIFLIFLIMGKQAV